MSASLRKFNLESTGLFDNLPLKERQQLDSGTLRIKAKKGIVLYREGSFPKGIYIVRKGKVKIFQTGKDGREHIMYIYTKGEAIGYRPLISAEPHPVTATTLEDCSFYFIPREHFLEILKSSNELARMLLVSLSHEFSVWVNNITVFAQQPVRVRVALGLLVLQEKFKVKGKPGDINLSRDDLAAYVGTVKETLVRVLQEFKRNNIIETQGRNIHVLDAEALAGIAGE